jgi:hypothetical protein
LSALGADLGKAFAQLSRGRAGHHEWSLCCEYAWGALTGIARSQSSAGEAAVAKLLGEVSSAAFAANASAWDRDDGLPEQRRYRSLHAMVRCLDALLRCRRAISTPNDESELARKLLATIWAFGATPEPAVADTAATRVGQVSSPSGGRLQQPGLTALEAGYDAIAEGWPESTTAVVNAKFWTRCLLSDPRRSTYVPILSVDRRNNKGTVSTLSIGAAGLGSALVVHPDSALRPVECSFLETVVTAWEAVRAGAATASSLWWNLPDDHAVALTDDSAGGAFAVGLGLAEREQAYDAATAVCAAIEQNGALREVNASELSRKLAAAGGHGILRAIVAGEQHVSVDQLSGVEVLRANSWREAAEVASRTAELVRGYLHNLTGGIKAEMGKAPFIDDVTPVNLYVEPELIEVQQREDRDGTRSDTLDEHAQPQALYGREDAASARRVSMSEFRAALAVHDTVMIEGMPGSGKSLLVRAETAELARTGLAQLASGARLNALLLPIRVELTALEAALAPGAGPELSEYRRALEGDSGEEAAAGRGPRSAADLELRAAIGIALERDVGRQCSLYLAGRLGDANVRLYFDGNDEVSEPETLAKPLAALVEWSTPVVVTSRPTSERNIWLRQRNRRYGRQYVLAPFSPSQIDSFLSRRFPGENELRDRTRQRLVASAPLGVMAQSPFLLTLLCWLSMKDLLSDELTRTQIYDRVVEEMLGWRRADGGVDAARALKLRRMLAEIVLRLFIEGRATGPIDGQYLADLIGHSRRRPEIKNADPLNTSGEEKAEAIIAELARKRVIVRIANGDERTPPQWAFPHLTIAEYLAGIEIADGLSQALHVGEQPLWLSALRARNA